MKQTKKEWVSIALKCILAILVWLVSKNMIVTIVAMYGMELFYSINGVKISFKRFCNIIAIIVLLLVLLFGLKASKKMDAPIEEPTEIVEVGEDPEEVVIEETSSAKGTSYKKVDRGYGVTDKIEATNHNQENLEKNDNVVIDDGSNDSTDNNSSSDEEKGVFKPQEQKDFEEDIQNRVEEAEKNPDQSVEKNPDGSIFIGGNEPDENNTSDNASDSTPEKGDIPTEDDKNWLLQNSQKNQPEENKKENQKVEEEGTISEVPQLESAPEIVEQESSMKSEEKASESTKAENTEVKKEEVKKADSTPVKIIALDGTTAYAGDSVQFKITGEVKTIEGLDGFDYYLDGEYLTIYTNYGEATIITIDVIGVNGTTASVDVIVNCIG